MPREGQMDVRSLLYLEAREGISEEVKLELKSEG